eukprot:CAMPEP_0170612584 /NCGR_PEP_ID=MMETSP0224-20130122/23801_1 /TAXON_ID=285029 /ORGANISM="Togula jolla, Strain CCCM 725" /LENGTH=63 /DNA_ID=CAMNT_0010938097 /DNA_START=637 /DNA_END=827 /DNA_ORIENTATION=-
MTGVVDLEVPDVQLVVVAAGGKLLLIVGPLQTADLLPMALQLRGEVGLLPHVPLQDAVVSAAG